MYICCRVNIAFMTKASACLSFNPIFPEVVREGRGGGGGWGGSKLENRGAEGLEVGGELGF